VTGISWEILGPSKVVIYYLDDGSRQLVWEDYRGKAAAHRINLYLSSTEKISRKQLIKDLKNLTKLEEGKIEIRKTAGRVPLLVSDRGRYISCLDNNKEGIFVLFELYDNLILKNTTRLISKGEININ